MAAEYNMRMRKDWTSSILKERHHVGTYSPAFPCLSLSRLRASVCILRSGQCLLRLPSALRCCHRRHRSRYVAKLEFLSYPRATLKLTNGSFVYFRRCSPRNCAMRRLRVLLDQNHKQEQPGEERKGKACSNEAAEASSSCSRCTSSCCSRMLIFWRTCDIAEGSSLGYSCQC